MSVQIVFEDGIVRGRDTVQLTQQAKEAMLLYDYINAQISLGEFAECMGQSLIETRDCLHKQGVSTSRKIRDGELAKSLERDRQEFKTQLGLT